MKAKSPTNENLPHKFHPTGNVETGKVWATTITEVKCEFCSVTYWVGRDQKPDTYCANRTLKAAVS